MKKILIFLLLLLFFLSCGNKIEMNVPMNNDLKLIFKAQKDIKYDMISHANKGLTINQILEFERTLGYQLTDDIRDLYKNINGISAKGVPLGKTAFFGLYHMMSIKKAVSYSKEMEWEEWKEYYNVESEVGKNFFSFLHNTAGDCYWVNLNPKSSNFGKIYWTNTLGEEPGYAFNSVNSLFEKLRIAYQEDAFSLSEKEFLLTNNQKWHEICLKDCPNPDIWQ